MRARLARFSATLVAACLSGCGVQGVDIVDCVPPVTYQPTPSVQLFLVEQFDPDLAYSDVPLRGDERYLCIATVHYKNCQDTVGGRLKFTPVPPTSTLTLTGPMRRFSPYGLALGTRAPTLYFKGEVGNTPVWLSILDLALFNEYSQESALNTRSNAALRIPWSNAERWEEEWTCPAHSIK